MCASEIQEGLTTAESVPNESANSVHQSASRGVVDHQSFEQIFDEAVPYSTPQSSSETHPDFVLDEIERIFPYELTQSQTSEHGDFKNTYLTNESILAGAFRSHSHETLKSQTAFNNEKSLDENSKQSTKIINPNGLLAKHVLPCQKVPDFDYNNCYSFYANGCYNTCQFVEFGDIEDFMNNEKRKEKSRDAARCRRSKETEIFNDLGGELPLNSEQISQLDKASVMRLAISYLKVRDMINLVPILSIKDKNFKNMPQLKDESIFTKTLDGFVLVLSTEGDFIYLSENVSDYLGITQIDLMGQNIFDYSHPCDHDELKEMLHSKTTKGDEDKTPKSAFIRMKCTLTSKGRSVNLKSATYKVIHCMGHMIYDPLKHEEPPKCNQLQSVLVAVGQPIPHPSNIDTPLPAKQTFLTKHNLDMKITDADDQLMMDVLGYTSNDLIDKSVYEYHHALDSESIGASFKCLFSKGQCETNRYRFLAKTGGYCWIVTQATLINDKMQKPQSVVCVNHVIR